ncbi:MAG: prepilin-type N-terminal cleavage/methylation domain-containing protein [Phycisphaerales bacterium]|nr:MAG: prepilin-type N-terminal cleavage/methylation domain-containing protein [Phycisphaerales bacterium]
MRRRGSHSVGVGSCRLAFSLIELLTVVAIISILMAVTVAALHRARILACRTVCASNLRQIATAWLTYLNDHDQRFYQQVNANHDFGGWKGRGSGALDRPLNPYLALPAAVNEPGGAEAFHCRGDVGDRDYGSEAYLYYGNSYQTNLVLIGPDSLPARQGLPEPIRTLNSRINRHLVNLRADVLSDWARLLLVGDNNWVTQWDPLIPFEGRAWHGKNGRYNLAFLDGHVAFTEIHRGVYINNDYRIQPFRELDDITHEMQSQIVELCGGQ